ncbi:UNVERIFIED_CONTAM: putative transcriptional regulator SLK2 [Sesamum angustifolium]|uniref:Transcriptional regulator SLK2 n=1 Tax=Sesamum angustifolium TaxID=2727405 RepID=A0AAW2LF60_9LAMI
MVPSRVAGGMAQSSSSGIFFQGDGQSQVAGNSQLSSNFGNPSHSIPGHARANMSALAGDVSNAVLNSVASSGPSVGASSLVTDANSGLSAGPHLQRSASFNTDSYMRLPASPMSFTSNNISISGSSVMDGSSLVQQSSNQDPGSLILSFRTDYHIPVTKETRLDIKQEDILQQQVLQQLLRQDPMHLQNPNPQLQALIQQQRLRQQQQQREQQQLLQSMPPMQRVQLLQQQQQQQQQLRQQILQQGLQPASGIKRPYDGGVCSRRLMQYLYHQRQRPAENTIAYWRKFVAEYYSPRAKKRWCLSLYDNVGHHSLGVFPQAAMDAWQCDICGSKSGREATFEAPRLNEIKFGSGVIDELLFLDLPRECRFPSGMMMLEYAKAVQESVYEQLRVVREGQLRIIFTPDLKILSWEFCARRHEELLPRRLVAPQVNQLLQVAQKCQSTISESGPHGVSQPDLQANSNIAEVVNSMKDLMDFSTEKKVGPIEGLKNFPRHASTPKVQIQETEQQGGGPQGLPTDRNTLNKLMAMQSGISSTMTNNQQMVGRGPLTGSAQAALALTNYQNLLMRQNSMNSTHNSSLQQEASSPFSTSSQAPTTPGPSGVLPGTLQNSPVSGFSSGQALQQQHSPSGNGLLQRNQSLPAQCGQALQQQMIQQLLQDMSNKNNGTAVPQQSLSVQNQGGNVSRDGLGFRGAPTTTAAGNGPGNAVGNPPSRSNSFKAASNGESPTPVGNMGFSQKTSDLQQNLHLPDELVSDVAHEFSENGFFNNDLDDNMNFSWKA